MNTSGLQPVEFKVLIKPEDVEETTASGIVLARDVTERERMSQVKGTLVAVGGNAFQDWNGVVPALGQGVYYAKYAGINIKGEDGKEYRLANDKDISAVLT